MLFLFSFKKSRNSDGEKRKTKKTVSKGGTINLMSNTFSIFISSGWNDARNFEPTCPEQGRGETRLMFENLDESIQKLKAIYKVHPEWFETPKPKSDKDKNVLDYSIK